MVKKKKNQDLKINKVKKDGTFWASMFILVLMVASVVAFGLSSNSSGRSGKNSDSQNIPFGQNFQNPDTGELFWGARINGENIIFTNVDGYEESLIESGLARKIKKQSSIKIYTDTNFTSKESVFLIQKGLRALRIGFVEIDNLNSCDEKTLVFTQNSSFKGDCMKFVSLNEDAQLKADKLLYHLVKDFN